MKMKADLKQFLPPLPHSFTSSDSFIRSELLSFVESRLGLLVNVAEPPLPFLSLFGSTFELERNVFDLGEACHLTLGVSLVSCRGAVVERLTFFQFGFLIRRSERRESDFREDFPLVSIPDIDRIVASSIDRVVHTEFARSSEDETACLDVREF